jgi:OmpA-OmpF porin, OOP family
MFPGLYPFRKRMTLKNALVGLLALCAAAASHAEPYVVASLGSSKLNLDCEDATSCDKRGTGLKLLGGYKLTPNFAIEAGYMDFGKAAAADETVSVNFENKAIVFGGAFHQDLSPDWALAARLGLASMKSEAKSQAGSVSLAADETSTQLYGGLGIGYRISPKVSLEASYDFTKAELDGSKANVNMFGIGVTVAF